MKTAYNHLVGITSFLKVRSHLLGFLSFLSILFFKRLSKLIDTSFVNWMQPKIGKTQWALSNLCFVQPMGPVLFKAVFKRIT